MKNSLLSDLLVPVLVAIFAAIMLVQFMQSTGQSAHAYSVSPKPAPEFTQTDAEAWLGSAPLKMSNLRGKVVLIDFWTYGCWNCYRSFPWMNDLERRYKDQDFQIIGIHTPEFEHEKERDNVVKKIEEFELDHPTMMDNDFGFWKRMGNRYWPTYYLIDKKGLVRYFFIGETHEGTDKAIAIESAIKTLLSET
ncbi:MAG: redoxin family protein [Pseudomonadota bacterium]